VQVARQLVKAGAEQEEAVSDTAPWRQALLEALHLKGAAANLEVEVGGEGVVDARYAVYLLYWYKSTKY